MGGGGKKKGGQQQQQQQQQQPPKQQPSGGGKAARRAANDEFEALLQEVKQTTARTLKLSTGQGLNLLISAFAMTGMPQIFFHSPVFYDVDIPAYKAQFIAVTVASALALFYAYMGVAGAHEAKLLATREVDGKGSREERAAAEVAMASSTNLESLSYALFVVNGLYLGGFLLLAFKACEAVGMQPAHVQLLSTLLPAVVLAARPTWVA